MNGSDEHLDNAHLMRMAGRFSRRVRGFAKAHGLPVIDCRRGERKHDLAEDYLATHTVERGLFLILVGRAEVPLWDVRRAGSDSIFLKQKKAYVNHYSFHCAARRLVVSPAQPGGTRREVPGSDGLPDAERLRGQEHAS